MGAGGEPHSNNWDSYEVESKRAEVRCISINVDGTSSSHDSARGQKPKLTGEYADKEIRGADKGKPPLEVAKELKGQKKIKETKETKERTENESRRVKL